MSNWQPFCLKNDFDEKTPVCAGCKKTNRTRTFCRERHKHRQLPWSTVYVILSALDSTDPSTVVAAPSQFKTDEDIQWEHDHVTDVKVGDDASNSKKGDVDADATLHHTDDIHSIEESRTFLAQVSFKHSCIHWLERAEGEGLAGSSESEVKALNDAIRNPSVVPVYPDMHMMPPQPYYPMMNLPQQIPAWHYGSQMFPTQIMSMPLGGVTAHGNMDDNSGEAHGQGDVQGHEMNNEGQENHYDDHAVSNSVSDHNSYQSYLFQYSCYLQSVDHFNIERDNGTSHSAKQF